MYHARRRSEFAGSSWARTRSISWIVFRVGDLILTYDRVGGEDNTLAISPSGAFQPIPRLADKGDVPDLDRRSEHIRDAVPGAQAAARGVYYVPRFPAFIGDEGKGRSLRSLWRGWLDRLRNGEPAELFQFSGVPCVQYDTFHGIAISFRLIRPRAFRSFVRGRK